MKKLLLTGVALALATGAAAAADLPRAVAPPVPALAPAVPAFTWTGFYAGVNAGYGFDARDDLAPTVIESGRRNELFVNGAGNYARGAVAFSNRRDTEGFVGGGQIGYNYQFGLGSGVVVGVEADAQYTDFGGYKNRYALSTGIAQAPGALLFNPNGQTALDYFGTLRGRLGYAFGNFLAYGTGGLAYTSGGDGPNNNGDFRTGWTAGGGVEYALPTNSFLNFFGSSAVTFKVEGLYVNLEGNRNYGAFAANGNGLVGVGSPAVNLVSGPVLRRNDNEFAVVRAGINYKFGGF